MSQLTVIDLTPSDKETVRFGPTSLPPEVLAAPEVAVTRVVPFSEYTSYTLRERGGEWLDLERDAAKGKAIGEVSK